MFVQLPLLQFGPAVPSLNQWLARSPPALALLSWATLAFEVLGVPLSLVMPPFLRPLLALGSLGLHVGIAAAQSAGIGLAFLPNVATYALGFSAAGPPCALFFFFGGGGGGGDDDGGGGGGGGGGGDDGYRLWLLALAVAVRRVCCAARVVVVRVPADAGDVRVGVGV